MGVRGNEGMDFTRSDNLLLDGVRVYFFTGER